MKVVVVLNMAGEEDVESNPVTWERVLRNTRVIAPDDVVESVTHADGVTRVSVNLAVDLHPDFAAAQKLFNTNIELATVARLAVEEHVRNLMDMWSWYQRTHAQSE